MSIGGLLKTFVLFLFVIISHDVFAAGDATSVNAMIRFHFKVQEENTYLSGETYDGRSCDVFIRDRHLSAAKSDSLTLIVRTYSSNGTMEKLHFEGDSGVRLVSVGRVGTAIVLSTNTASVSGGSAQNTFFFNLASSGSFPGFVFRHFSLENSKTVQLDCQNLRQNRP